MPSPPNRHHVRTLIAVAAVHALTALAASAVMLIWSRGTRELPVQGAGLTLIVGGMALAAFMSGFALTRRILNPVQRFVERAEDLLPEAGNDRTSVRGRPAAVFDRIEALLINLDERPLFPEVVFSNRRMQIAMRQVRMLAPAGVDALVSGETGTGKTLIAEMVHRHSPRRNGPLVRLTCSHQPPENLARELFGLEDTTSPAIRPKPAGALAQACDGTLLLEEIAALPMALQVHLCTHIDAASEHGRNGRSDRVAIGLVATTRRDLSALVAAGQFHRALYDRLTGFWIQLPPLRCRIEDIALLAAHFLPADRDDHVLDAFALQALVGYPWPGNVKEFKSVIEAAFAASGGSAISREHLPVAIQAAVAWPPAAAVSKMSPPSIDDRLQAIEKQMIEEALKQTAGVQVRAAKLMGINQRSLWHRLKKFGIDAAAFKKDGPLSARKT
jgi:DNA-binding NtrC family response regulator